MNLVWLEKVFCKTSEPSARVQAAQLQVGGTLQGPEETSPRSGLLTSTAQAQSKARSPFNAVPTVSSHTQGDHTLETRLTCTGDCGKCTQAVPVF